MTPTQVCVALCLALLTAPASLRAAPALPDPSTANLLSEWQQVPFTADDGVFQGECCRWGAER